MLGLPDNARILFYDLETGGIEDRHPTIQIAASVWDVGLDGELASFQRKLQFDPAACSPQALEVNAYSPEGWVDAVDPATGWQDFFRFCGEHRSKPMVSKKGNQYLVTIAGGHNVTAFDFPRVVRAARKLDAFMPLWWYQLDTYALAVWARALGALPEMRLNLESLSTHFGVGFSGEQHDALVDCRLAARVCRHLLKLLRPDP